MDLWKSENPWPSENIKFKNKKQKYRAAKSSFVEEKVAELAFSKCMDYEFIVWTSVSGAVDVRCEKCFHLYPFQMEISWDRLRERCFIVKNDNNSSADDCFWAHVWVDLTIYREDVPVQ